MGDMADWVNDNGFWAILTGEDQEEPTPVKCRNCNEDNLHWETSPDDGKWRLYDSTCKIHKCPVRPLRNGSRKWLA